MTNEPRSQTSFKNATANILALGGSLLSMLTVTTSNQFFLNFIDPKIGQK